MAKLTVASKIEEPTAEEAIEAEEETFVELEEPKRWQVVFKAAYPHHGQQFTFYTEEEVRAECARIYGADYEIADLKVIE